MVIERKVPTPGAALDLAKRGGIDAVISDAPALEERFVADGWGISRQSIAAIELSSLGRRIIQHGPATAWMRWQPCGA